MFNRKFLLVIPATLLLAFYFIGCGKKTGEEAPVPSTETGAPATGGGTPYTEAMGTATINGKVAFTGQAPDKIKINMSAEPTCAAEHKAGVYAQDTEVNTNGTLPYVFVYVKQGAEKYSFTPPANPVTIDQAGCQYSPHVLGLQAGQSLQILNSDPFLHNIHSYPTANKPFNEAMPTKGDKRMKKYDKPEVMIPVKCDVHKWMVSYIGVLPHPFYSVTGADGAFSLKALPPGEYVVEAWHEKHGSKTQNVTVGDKETKEITFTF